MKFIETGLKGAYVIELSPLKDERGGFVRTFCKKEFEQIGHSEEFVQFNQSYNNKKGTIRGMHYQEQPVSEIKLIRCVKGQVYDVIIDLRQGSDTFLKWFSIELSESNKRMLYIPKGFAHGFQTLQDNSELIYHHTQFYTPTAERGLRYDDVLLGIEWPEKVSIISEKDKNYTNLTVSFKGIEL